MQTTLQHEDLPSDFHIINDFLAQSEIGFALSNPVKVSYKVVMQVWNTATVNAEHGTFSFKHGDEVYNITPEVVDSALQLPLLHDQTPDNFSNETLFQFVRRLGYAGNFKKIGKLYRI